MGRRVNWLQAFAELALLVLGVGLALAADAWNDARRERRTEAEYLISLQRDFEQTRANFVQALEGNRMVRDNDLAFLGALSGPPGSISEDSLNAHTQFAFWLYWFEPILGTYHDMVNSGSLPLLRSDSLRLALAQFETDLAGLQLVVSEGWEQYNAIQAPFMIEQLNVRQFHSGEYRGLEFPAGGRSPDLSAYWSPEFANILAVTVISRQDIIANGEEVLESVDRILRLIERARANSGAGDPVP